jgi:hypothetical protein
MRSHLIRFFAAAGLVALAAVAHHATAAPPADRGTVWAGCERYGTFGTPARVEHGPFDHLYKSPAGFKDGIGAISDAAPGHGNYNGGRWEEYALKAGVDGSKYANACSVNDLDLNDFEPTGVRFQCPMLKQ